MTAATTMPDESVARNWSERNQRWLAQRIAIWRERIEARNRETLPAPPPLEDAEFQPSALRLRSLFGLSAFETELLIAAAGVDIDAAFRAVVAQAQGLSARDAVRINYSLALAVLPQPHWDAISPLGPLRHWLLADFDMTAGIAQASVRVDERVLHFLTGVAAFDDRLAGIVERDDTAHDAAPQALAMRIGGELTRVAHPLVLLVNAASDPQRRRAGRTLARAAFHRIGLNTLWVQLPGAGLDNRDLAELARRIDREAVLSHAGVALGVSTDAVHAATAVRLIDALHSPVIALGAPSAADLADLVERTPLRFSVPPMNASPPADVSATLQRAGVRALQQFRVDPALLNQALASAAGLEDEAAVEQQVWHALRESARGGLDALAQRIESTTTFDDLVVPSSLRNQLQEIASQLRHRQQVYDEWGFGARDRRGLGIAALFSGESGTGKTLAAEAIANEARLDLYRIDLACVVSKYIGETEKNLSRVFDAAEHSGAVLLFDEADALFGKRSEVKDSHDRYANIEVAFLLQRVESYGGLAILTTNMKSALDRAFLRRIRFVVQFPFPDDTAREEIWRRQFPPQAPVDRIDFTALSRLQLSGGNIRSVALNAAFHAAARQEPIGQEVLLMAARAELAKLERSFTTSVGTR
jgi:hypothetical protein